MLKRLGELLDSVLIVGPPPVSGPYRLSRRVHVADQCAKAVPSNHRVIGKQIQGLALGTIALIDMLAKTRHLMGLAPAVALVAKAVELNAWYHFGVVIHKSRQTIALENGVVACDIAMLEPVGAAPYREHELADELFGCVAAVGAGLGQARLR